MKRVIVCLLACMLLISGMLVYVSAENFAPVDPDIIFDFDWDFQYDDSKVYPLVIQVGIISTYQPGTVQLGPIDDPFASYSGGPFVDLEEYMNRVFEVTNLPYDSEKLPPELQLDDTIYCLSGLYQITFDNWSWPVTQHDLISIAHYLVTEPLMWMYVFGIDPEEADEYSVYVSLVEKEVETQNWDDFEEFRTDSQLYFHEDTLRVGVDLTYVPRYYSWSKEDFPELEDLKDVDVYIYKENNPYVPDPYVELTLTFNTPGRETLEDAMQKLGKRYEFDFVHFDYGIAVIDVPIDPPTVTTDETTVPVGDIETTEPAITDETTNVPEGNQPTSPQTGDAGRYAACICAAALIGVAGVLLYRKRRAA